MAAWGESGTSSSLFNTFASGKSPKRKGNGTTRSAILREKGTRICCYLNCEGGTSGVVGATPPPSGTIVKLPEECDTMEEVLILIQARLKLDGRMLFASELYDVNGGQINTMEQVTEMGRADAPIVVGCGEPFDSTRIPTDLREIQLRGGGRKGAENVMNELKTRREQMLREKAEEVRRAGHGASGEAVKIARLQNMEVNREHVTEMRHKYMESLLIRAAQQEELMSSVKSNIGFHKAETAESRARQEENHRERMLMLAAERRVQKEEFARLKSAQVAKIKAQVDKVRASSPPKEKRAKRVVPGRAAKSARPAAKGRHTKQEVLA